MLLNNVLHVYFFLRLCPAFKLLFGTYTFIDFTDADMVFTVSPNKLNFAGVFIFEDTNHGARADLHDRSAISIKLLEQQYPYLLHRYQWHNALMPSDPFLAHYYDERYNQEAE